MADTRNPATTPDRDRSENRPSLPLLGVCGCGSGCGCGCQSGGSCSCGGNCGS
jgi:hypothetical protein